MKCVSDFCLLLSLVGAFTGECNTESTRAFFCLQFYQPVKKEQCRGRRQNSTAIGIDLSKLATSGN